MKRTSSPRKAVAKPSRAKTQPATKPRKVKPAAKKSPPKKAAKASPAARTPPATATPPARRAIFIDVENTSSEAALLRVLDHLNVDRKAQPTEVIAIGNWKSVGTKVARTLASLGAQLMHSAPTPGVRDWSDLWIAVNAGRWLAQAAPGDQLDVVSDDRAFDAVHDAAASVGVICNRISYRHIPGAAPVAPAPEERPQRPRRRGGRGRGRRTGIQPQPPAASAHHPPTDAASSAHTAEPPLTAVQHAAAHAASQQQIRAILARLTGGDSARWVNLDLLANALKAEGFSRPPGSPRLITRVRSIKGVELNPNGMLRLVSDAAAGDAAPAADDVPATEEGAAAAAPRRPRRRGGRRHRRRTNGEAGSATATTAEEAPADEGSEID